MCAHAVRVAVTKLPGVESVEVSLTRAVADITLRAGNTITLPALRDVIKKNGFSTKEADITAIGDVFSRDGTLVLSVTGTNAELTIAATSDPKVLDVLRDETAGSKRSRVGLSGTIQPNEPSTLIAKGMQPNSP